MDNFLRVAALSDFNNEGLLAVRVEGEDVVLFKVKDQVFASRDFCPHAGFPLSKGFFRDKYVRCPLHYWEFNVTNGEYTHNPRTRMRCYPVKVENGEVWVSMTPIPPKVEAPPPSRDEA